MSNYILDLINGDALAEEVDDYIDRWHESDTKLELHEFLGMTWEEYTLYIEDKEYLAYIVNAHQRSKSIREVVKEDYISLAARAGSYSKANQILSWLKKYNLWEDD